MVPWSVTRGGRAERPAGQFLDRRGEMRWGYPSLATVCLVALSIAVVPVLTRDQHFEYDEDLARLCVVRVVVLSFAEIL